MATHSSILAWRILWAEDPGGLQSMWLQRVRYDWLTNLEDELIIFPNLKSENIFSIINADVVWKEVVYIFLSLNGWKVSV